MCGIIGRASQLQVDDHRWIRAGLGLMSHRGPDDSGEWSSTDGRVALGHRRLSIVDLSPAGHQPMLDSSGDLCIVFNGEIYNFNELRAELLLKGHGFRSDSDTEVILSAYREWGTECLLRLNGMFALAIYDSKRRLMFMARDRAGEKPLFYSQADGVLRFSSELKGLMAHSDFVRRIDQEAMDCYLAMGFVPGDRCILQGVKKLPPAHAMVFDLENGRSRVWRYWQLPDLDDAAASGQVNEVDLLDELEILLEDSVRRQLAADVPVGVLLSGGVDSSLVTAMAVRSSQRVRTFTIRFPGHGEFDETEHARFIARYFGTEHVELDAAQSTVDLLPVLARQFDEPLVDSSMIPTYLVSRLVRDHCTVALGGDGGDELFGGYPHYSRLLWMQRNLRVIPRPLRIPVSYVAEMFMPVGFRGRNWLQGLSVDFDGGLPLIASYYDKPTRRALMSGIGQWPLVAGSVRAARVPETNDLLQRATRMDFCNYMAEDILVKVDRASMLNSLEVRAPLLDYRIIEFAFGRVPSHLKATALKSKVLLKKLVERILPPGFDQHRKQGFSIPLHTWLQSGPWHTFFREVLLDSNDVPFCRRTVNKIMNGQAKGRSNSERLFALVMFELWRREYGIAL